MPCECSGYGPSDYDRVKAEADKVTVLLCDLCRHLEVVDSGSRLSDLKLENLLTPPAARWWEEHKKADNLRAETEKVRAESERQKKLRQFLDLKKQLGV